MKIIITDMELTKGVLLLLVLSGTRFDFSSSQETDMIADVRFRCYFGNAITVYEEFDLEEALDLYERFDENRYTVLYIHGWRETVDGSKTVSDIVTAFLERDEHNVCVLNYEKLAGQFYTRVVESIPTLGEKVGLVLKNWIENGFNYSSFRLIGFSLGAHISSVIARTLQREGYKLPRITGLDPAKPLFCDTAKASPNALSKTDADFVDVIHTDGRISGCIQSLGHADFFPNHGVRPQPGCGNNLLQFLMLLFGDHCAHDAATLYYAKSVTAKTVIYLATNRLNKLNTATMGYNCSIKSAGDYELAAT